MTISIDLIIDFKRKSSKTINFNLICLHGFFFLFLNVILIGFDLFCSVFFFTRKQCKAIILLALVAAVNCAFNHNYYNQQRQQYHQQPRNYYNYQQGPDANAQILRNEQQVNPDSFHYAYETSNGIRAQEDGQLKQIGRDAAIVTQGSYSYISPEGKEMYPVITKIGKRHLD